MSNLIDALKKIAKESPLNQYEWGFPTDCPIDIPAEYKDSYLQNIYLKDNFREKILGDDSLDSHYWVIQNWGGIGSFRRNERNDLRIKKFLDELNKGTLTRNSFECISSLSKVASFINPDEYAIYDSRAIYTLNWLLFNHSESSKLFRQPIGRSANLSKYDMETIFNLTKREFNFLSHKEAFHSYCGLVKHFACEIYGPGSKPYLAEMLLFMVAPTRIIKEIEDTVSLTITKTHNATTHKEAVQ